MTKSNLRYIITYIIFIILFIIGAVFYRQPFLAILVLLLFVLPLISIYITVKLAPKIIFSAQQKQVVLTEGNKISLHLKIKNPTWFSFLNILLSFKYENCFYPGTTQNTLSVSAPFKRENIIELNFETSKSGMCRISLGNCTITDPLHLYTLRHPCQIDLEIPIFPLKEEQNFPIYPAAFADTEEDEPVTSSLVVSMDLKEIREFRPGDRLKDIHWKASARKDDILVKSFENSAERVITLLPELCSLELNQTLRTIYGYMLFLVQNNEIFKLKLYNGSDFETFQLQNNEDVENVIFSLLYAPIHTYPEEALETYKHIYGSDSEVLWIHGKNILQK